MRAMYYPVLVIVTYAGLFVVAANAREWEGTQVCVRCGRVQHWRRLDVFHMPLAERREAVSTAYTDAVAGGIACRDCAWRDANSSLWDAVRGRSASQAGPGTLAAVLADPLPVLRLGQVSRDRANRLLNELMEGEALPMGYWGPRGRWVQRTGSERSAAAELAERLREGPMAPEELRAFDAEHAPKPAEEEAQDSQK